MGLFSFLFGIGGAIDEEAEKQEERKKDLESIPKEEIKKGNYESFNFEEDDREDEDDYYHEDD